MKLVWLKKLCIGIFVLLGIELFVDISVPGLVNIVEVFLNQPLSFESVLRMYLFSFFLLTLSVCGVWLSRIKRTDWNFFYLGYCGWFFALSIIFAFDRHHRLFEEYSWIRYATALSLIAACGISFYSLIVYRKIHSRIMTFVLGLFGCAFLFVGLDELFQIHEAVGNMIEKTGNLPHVITDYITVFYALIGLIFIAGFFRWYKKIRELNILVLFFLCAGIVAYIFSTALDTLDVVVLDFLRKLAVQLSQKETFVFSDMWYPVWSVKNSLNGLEEVLEYFAAFSFFLAMFSLSITQGKKEVWKKISLLLSQKFFIGLGITTGCLIGIGIFLSFPLLIVKTPLVNSSLNVSRIASAHDGLFHVDDLFYHPSWGVLIADEGSRGIYQWNNGFLQKIPDLFKKIRNADSVTATGTAIFVSDPESGSIFSYTKKDGFVPLWTRADGLVQPEGLVAVGDTLYVVDESQKSITQLKKGKEPIIWKPQHADFKAPEDITYNPVTKKLFITDDVSGAIFEADFGKSLQVLSRLPKPESITFARQDGSLFVTDTRWGAVFNIDSKGRTEQVFQLHRNYRDLQGIAIDRDGDFYVSTSDGYGSSSFMPSFVFKVSSK